MNKHFQKLRATIALFFFSIAAKAQSAPGAEDVMRSNGKIYVVVAVCLTILLGLLFYVYSVDRKISKLEKEK